MLCCVFEAQFSSVHKGLSQTASNLRLSEFQMIPCLCLYYGFRLRLVQPLVARRFRRLGRVSCIGRNASGASTNVSDPGKAVSNHAILTKLAVYLPLRPGPLGRWGETFAKLTESVPTLTSIPAMYMQGLAVEKCIMSGYLLQGEIAEVLEFCHLHKRGLVSMQCNHQVCWSRR